MSAQVIPLPVRHTPNGPEPLLSKKQLAAHYGFSTRWVELRVNEGMPSALIGGRRRFKLSEIDHWLKRRSG
jgi:predicted DNA-binding transcriptional regulator AlpA